MWRDGCHRLALGILKDGVSTVVANNLTNKPDGTPGVVIKVATCDSYCWKLHCFLVFSFPSKLLSLRLATRDFCD